MLILCLFFISGCVQQQYKHDIFRPNGTLRESYVLSGLKLNVHDTIKNLYIYLPDGAVLYVGERIVVADPNSGYAEAAMIGAGISLGGTERIKNLFKDK